MFVYEWDFQLFNFYKMKTQDEITLTTRKLFLFILVLYSYVKSIKQII